MQDAKVADEGSGRGRHVLIKAATVDIEGSRVLSDLSLDVDVRRLGVVGRNGSGKSTLARLLGGLIAPDQGEVRIDGHDLFQDRATALQEVGILFQNPDHQIIFPSVLEEMEFGLRQLGMSGAEARTRATETLDGFGKAGWRDAPTAALSQGQKHLLCLMAVAAMQPKLIVLDEPFAGLDLPTKLQLRRYLDRFEGAVIHITHDPAELEAYDQIVWLEAGAIVRVGPAPEVLVAYSTEMTRIGESDDIPDVSG